MNVTQARELYSGYYEGTLESGSAQALKLAIENDSEIKEDYEAFASVMDALPALSEEPIAIPHDLHDRVMRKIDQYDWEKKQNTAKFSITNLQKVFLGAAAAAAILFAAVSAFQPKSSADVSTADFTGSQQAASFKFSAGNQLGSPTLNLDVLNAKRGTVTVRSELGDSATVDVAKQQDTTPIVNSAQTPVLFWVEMKGVDPVSVVIPGSKPLPVWNGNGTLAECARAVAGTFNVPVQIEGQADVQVRWSFTQKDNDQTIVAALERTGIGASVSEGGLLRIRAK